MLDEVEPQKDFKRKCICLQCQQGALAEVREGPGPTCHMGEKEAKGMSWHLLGLHALGQLSLHTAFNRLTGKRETVPISRLLSAQGLCPLTKMTHRVPGSLVTHISLLSPPLGKETNKQQKKKGVREECGDRSPSSDALRILLTHK